MNRIISTPASHLRHLRRQDNPVKAISEPPFAKSAPWLYEILDPSSPIVARWNRIFLIACLISLFIDPLYFFLPYVGGPACMTTDVISAITITYFRTLADMFFVLHIVMKFRTAFVAPSSRVFGRGELVMDSHQIAVRYFKSDFIIDLAACLPLPQILNWLIIPAMKNNRADHAHNTLVLILLIQYVPRLFVMFPLNQRIIKTTGVVANTAWAGAAYNLLLYMLASHVLGAAWYLMSISRQHECWRDECLAEAHRVPPCNLNFLDCNSLGQIQRNYWLNFTKVLSTCDANNEDSTFKFG